MYCAAVTPPFTLSVPPLTDSCCTSSVGSSVSAPPVTLTAPAPLKVEPLASVIAPLVVRQVAPAATFTVPLLVPIPPA